jgi:hypothetical protein
MFRFGILGFWLSFPQLHSKYKQEDRYQSDKRGESYVQVTKILKARERDEVRPMVPEVTS